MIDPRLSAGMIMGIIIPLLHRRRRMKPLKIFAIVLILGVIGRPFVIEPSHAQDDGQSLPMEIWGYVDYAAWSPDGSQFTFTTDYDFSTDPPTWYTYAVETEQVLTSNLYPIPVQFADLNQARLQIPDYALMSSRLSVSPSRQYVAYPSTNLDRSASLLGIANLQTGKFAIMDVHLFGDLRYEWSADEKALVVETVIPYGIAYNTYHIERISPELNEVTSTFIRRPSVPLYNFFDLNPNNTLAVGYSQDDDRVSQIFVWSLDDLAHYTLIYAPAGLIDAQFSLTHPNTILAIIGSDLVEYDISSDPIEIRRTPLGIPDIWAAYFSPDQTHIAIISQSEHDYYQIVQMENLPTDSPE